MKNFISEDMSLKITFLNSAIYGKKNRENLPQLEGSSGFQTAANPLRDIILHITSPILIGIINRKQRIFSLQRLRNFESVAKVTNLLMTMSVSFLKAQLSATGTIVTAFPKQQEFSEDWMQALQYSTY